MLYFMVTCQEQGYLQEYLGHFKYEADAQAFVQSKIKQDYVKKRTGPIVYRIFEEDESTAKALLGTVNENKKTFICRHVYDYDVIRKGEEAINKPTRAKSVRFLSQGTGGLSRPDERDASDET